MNIQNLTESEELVMKAVWNCRKEPVLSDIVLQANGIYGKDWAPQTISTFLAKLVRKKFLKLQRDGKIYTYKVLVSEKEYKRKLYKQHIGFWNDNDVVEFCFEMVRNGDLTKEHLSELPA